MGGLLSPLPRSYDTELLDDAAPDPAALGDNLRDLRTVDSWLGSTALTWRTLRPMLLAQPRTTPLTLLDVATGGAAGPAILAARAQRLGYDLRPLASDRLREALLWARDCGATFPLIQHDALAIPLADRAADFVTCSLAFHHFDPPAAVALLRELARVARHGVIVNDLMRARLPYWGARLLALGPWHAMARHDGPLSVLRAYTLDEAQALVEASGAKQATVAARRFFRYTITITQ